MDKIWKNAFVNAISTTVYITLVASLLYFGGQAKIGAGNSILIPITFLLLFVLSAAFTSFMIFGRPVLLYLDGKKADAIKLLAYTLSILSVITIIAIILLIFYGA
jgi:hypothetical protein